MSLSNKKVPLVFGIIKKGDWQTKMSALVFGFGNFLHGQVIKGLLFLSLEAAFILYMIMFGVYHVAGLLTLGTHKSGQTFDEAKQVYVYISGDNSMLFLLYGIITLLIIIAFVFLWRASVKSAYNTQVNAEQGKRINTFRDDLYDLFDGKIQKTLLFIPSICVIVFTILPLVFMASMAFTNYDRDHQPPGQLFHWVGLKNFAEIFDANSGLGTAFWHVLAWTLVWAVFATFLNYILGTILAMVINRKETRGKTFWRFIFALSIAVPQFVSLLIMRTMLQPDGVVNETLKSWGWISQSLPFWTNATWARVSIIVINLWVGIPFTIMQTTGVLQNIPSELYESAEIDGASKFTIFVKITLPYMLFVTAPYLITQFIGNINNFNVIYLLTKGAPATLSYHNGTAGKTDLLVTWLYKLTIDFKDYNYGAVIGIMVFALSAIFALMAYRQTGAYKDEEGFQ